MCVKRVQMNYFWNIYRFWILSLLLKAVTCLQNCSIIQGSSPNYRHCVCQIQKDAFQDTFTSDMGARCHSDEIWVFCPDPSTELGDAIHRLIGLGGPAGAGFAVEIVSVHLGVLIFMVITTVTSLSLLAYISIRTHCQCLSMKKKRWSDIELKSQTNDKHNNEHTHL